MGVKLVGFHEAFEKLEAAARRLDDEKRVADIGLAAVAPMVEAVRDKIGTGSAWKETGLTAADIHAAVDKESELGHVKIAIGAGEKHAFKVRLNELGTSKQSAYPSLRPGHDETIDEVRTNIGKGIAELVTRG